MIQRTGKFKAVEETIIVCDSCHTKLDPCTTFSYDFKSTDGYDYYGEKYECCSMKCLLEMLETEVEDYKEYHFPYNEDVTLVLPSKVMYDLLKTYRERKTK